jgi:hypothetical protein
MQRGQNRQQIVSRRGQSVAVGQKHPPGLWVLPRHGLNIGVDGVQRANREGFGAVHRTEATPVEAATERYLQNEAVCFGRRSPDRQVVMDGHGTLQRSGHESMADEDQTHTSPPPRRYRLALAGVGIPPDQHPACGVPQFRLGDGAWGFLDERVEQGCTALVGRFCL